jgi:hypothetical protein
VIRPAGPASSVPFVPGALVFVVAMVVVVPVGVMATGALWSAVFGWLEPADVESEPGSSSGSS